MDTVIELSRQGAEALSKELGEPAWLLEKRREAWADFARLPYPTLRTEGWRYTDIRKVPFETIPLAKPAGLRLRRSMLPAEISKRIAQAELAGFAVFLGADLVYVELPEELQKKGVVLTSLHEALKTHPREVRKALFTAVGASDKLASYNAALFTHGAFMLVPANVEFDQPIGVFNYLEDGRLSIGRTLILAQENSKAVYIEEFISSAEGQEAVSLSASELVLEPGAKLRHTNLQTLSEGFDHFRRQRAVLGRDAHLNDLAVSMGAGLSRAEVQSELAGPGADSEMLGLYFAHGDQHLDHYTLQHHVADHTRSDVLYKGTARDKGRTVYSGLIKLEPGAQQTDAYQTNRNLLLSSEARADSVPQLEIAANDVRCSHGSSTAPVDKTQLFYLMSRGIPQKDAEQLLVKAFLADVLARVPLAALRAHIERVIEGKMGL